MDNVGVNAFFQAVEWLMDTRTALYKVVALFATVLSVFWSSIFLYGTFYYFYIPPVSHLHPVHLQFDTLCHKEDCRYPSANVSLLYRGQPQLLTRGQTYKIYLDLEMPESPVNRATAGMFMVKLDIYTRNGVVIQSSYRSALLHYKSLPIRLLQSVVFSPFMLFGTREEKQQIEVLLFDAYVEDYSDRAAGANIEIHSHAIEIYSAFLRIEAHLTGLRYIMFQWPITSAFIGIITNFFFLSFMAMCSWFKYLFSHKSVEQAKDDTNSHEILHITHPRSRHTEHVQPRTLSSMSVKGPTAYQRSYLGQVLGSRTRHQLQIPLTEISFDTTSDTVQVENLSHSPLFENTAAQSVPVQEAHTDTSNAINSRGEDSNPQISESDQEHSSPSPPQQSELLPYMTDPDLENLENETFENALEVLSGSPNVRRRVTSPAQS